jgi:hypothetical protein
MTEPATRDSIAHLGFDPLYDGPSVENERVPMCPQPASVYIEYHPVGSCNLMRGLNEQGNKCAPVCPDCLGAYAKRAEDAVAELNRRTAWWRQPPVGKCSGCGQVVQLPSDVLQVVKTL